jgi:hypothetical protein
MPDGHRAELRARLCWQGSPVDVKEEWFDQMRP